MKWSSMSYDEIVHYAFFDAKTDLERALLDVAMHWKSEAEWLEQQRVDDDYY